MKMPALQFYVGDWRKDPGVQSLDFFTRGVWFEMLCLMHESTERGVLLLNGMPMPKSALSRLLGIDENTLDNCLQILESYGIFSKRNKDSAIFSRRMVKDERIISARRKAGSSGGNPRLLNQNSSKTLAKDEQSSEQITTPSFSSSVLSKDNTSSTSSSPSGAKANPTAWWTSATKESFSEKVYSEFENLYPKAFLQKFIDYYSQEHVNGGISINHEMKFSLESKLRDWYNDPKTKERYPQSTIKRNKPLL